MPLVVKGLNLDGVSVLIKISINEDFVTVIVIVRLKELALNKVQSTISLIENDNIYKLLALFQRYGRLLFESERFALFDLSSVV